MILRLALFVLLIAVVWTVVGRLRRLGAPRRDGRPAIQTARKCPTCKAYTLGRDPAPCARPDCPYRRQAA